MKKNISLAFVIIAFSATLFAAEPPTKKPKDQHDAASHKMQHKHDSDRPKMKGHPHLGSNVLFDVTLKSTDPIKTIKNVIEVIPAVKAKQYQVHISIIEVPEAKFDGKPVPPKEPNAKK